jgi:hypothetical protein
MPILRQADGDKALISEPGVSSGAKTHWFSRAMSELQL